MLDWQAVQPFIVSLLGLGLTALGWWGRTLYDRVAKVEDVLAAFKIEVAKDYVSFVRFAETMQQVHGTLGRIEGKLDSKQDK